MPDSGELFSSPLYPGRPVELVCGPLFFAPDLHGEDAVLDGSAVHMLLYSDALQCEHCHLWWTEKAQRQHNYSKSAIGVQLHVAYAVLAHRVLPSELWENCGSDQW